MMLKSVLRELILPPASLLLLALTGLGLAWRGRRAGLVMALIATLALTALSLPVLGTAVYRMSEVYPALRWDTIGTARAIVILSGGGTRDYAPEWAGPAVSADGWDRIAYGAMLARRSHLPVLLTCAPREAPGLRGIFHTVFGLDPAWTDESARDTFDNARHARQILAPLGIRRILLVTHSSHMARAVDEFRAAGFDVVPAPVVVAPQAPAGIDGWLPGSLTYAHLGLYELIGRPVSALLRHWRD